MIALTSKLWTSKGFTFSEQPMTSKEALNLAQLDWDVEQVPLYAGTKQIEDYIANVRSDTKDVLGIVSPRYRVVQNTEAFDFVDDIMSAETECKYESAGSFDNGKRVFLLARLPDTSILEQDVASFLFFTNSHDGKSSLKCGVTNIQIVCKNTLQLAIKEAPRLWSLRHMSSIEGKKQEALETLKFSQRYIEEFQHKAYELAKKKYNIDKFLNDMFPLEADISDRVKRNQESIREFILNKHNKADYISDIRNTAWGCYQAFTDWSSNAEPLRVTDTYEDKKLVEFFDGSVLYDKAQYLLEA